MDFRGRREPRAVPTASKKREVVSDGKRTRYPARRILCAEKRGRPVRAENRVVPRTPDGSSSRCSQSWLSRDFLFHRMQKGDTMYKHAEEEPRKHRLTYELIRRNLAREVKGACIALAFPTVLLLLPLTILCIWSAVRVPVWWGKIASILGALLMAGLPAWMYTDAIRHLRHIRCRPLSVMVDTVETIESYATRGTRRWWRPGRRRAPSDIFRFVGGGTYVGLSDAMRDSLGDEYYLICFTDRPDDILDLYRITEYEWNPIEILP